MVELALHLSRRGALIFGTGSSAWKLVFPSRRPFEARPGHWIAVPAAEVGEAEMIPYSGLQKTELASNFLHLGKVVVEARLALRYQWLMTGLTAPSFEMALSKH